jgi:tetratricopeptide (TPR) repeat protein
VDQTEIELEGQRYVWDGRRWHATKTFQIPPAALASRLNALLAKFLANEDTKITDFNGLLQIAQISRSASQYKRAEAAARRAIALQPASEPAFAILCSALRHLGAADKAVQETEHLQSPKFPPLLVSRAAALCDLERWEEAKTTLGRATALKSSPEASEVVQRIKAKRPDLYEAP